MSVDVITIIISVVSALVAVISVVIARRSNKTAEKIYSADIVRQIFDLYRSESMLESLQLTWRNYRQEWHFLCQNDEEKAEQKANSGVPIPYDTAKDFIERYLAKKEDSREWAAFHEVSSFWKYIALLVSEDMIDEFHISTFTSPEILGFLYPFEVAYCTKKRIKLYPKTALKTLFEKYCSRNIINPSK